MMKGRIAEVFESIQGEGLYLGEKQLFVRFFGCNLNCRYCDTKLRRFLEYEPEELFKEIKLYPNHYHSISFTGGEPLLQKDFLKDILKLTRKQGFKNYLETNGTLYDALEEVIDDVDIIAMDLKFPSSTGLEPFWKAHRKFLKAASSKEVFLKTVICSSTHEDDLRETLVLIKEIDGSAILILQPNSYESNGLMTKKIADFKDICIKENITVCVIPQVHKVIGLR